MTDPVLRDEQANYTYYQNNKGYVRDDGRLREHRVQWAAERLNHGLQPGMRVLDVGCNDGFLAELLVEGAQYHGFDLNMVALGRPYPRAQDRTWVGNAMDPQQWGLWHYDRIFLGEVLEHVPHPLRVLRFAHARLAHGGRLASTSATGPGEEHEPGNQEHLREWALPEFVELHEKAGFEVLEGGLARVYGERYTNVVHARKVDDP